MYEDLLSILKSRGLVETDVEVTLTSCGIYSRSDFLEKGDNVLSEIGMLIRQSVSEVRSEESFESKNRHVAHSKKTLKLVTVVDLIKLKALLNDLKSQIQTYLEKNGFDSVTIQYIVQTLGVMKARNFGTYPTHV